ncbi:ribbon-helix-helix domain-containing protein [uncultured Cohaesibacter sp.]|uniref:ribbon-helix-helix domain-containing protein n=1 Tax=uncultured Cohaesibacter sp. TaxID=1002546 RepID=UPI0029C898C6|nr:ribbon-helix-helix domain-containing protein [uncultured Cohaesibacter sp.]
MKKHSVTISGHRTSISLEDEFWQGLKALAASRRKSLADIIRQIDRDRGPNNLSSAIRLTVLNHYKSQIPSSQTPS